jgi:HlyD family secretion protein
VKLKKKTLFLIVGAVVVVGAVLGLTVFKNGKNGEIGYRKEAVARGNIEALVVTTGTLNPMEIVDVGSQVSGKVDKLYADFNSQVTRGQVVAELDQDLLKMKVQQSEANYQSAVASLDRAKVTLGTAENQYERAKSLFDKNLISIEEKEAAEAAYLGAKSDVTSTEARLAQAKSQLDSSKVDLSYSIIRSPVDGIVITRKINIGQTVQASFTAPVLFQVATDLTKMKVECSVDEADIGKVKENQIVRFTVEAFPDDTFRGTVRQVRYSPETVQNVVTYTTIVDVENPEKKLRPGMTATVSIIVGEAKNVLRVPNAALRFTPNLPAEEMQKILKEMGDRMQARRQGEGGTGAPAGGPSAPAGQTGGGAAPAQVQMPGASPSQGGRQGGGFAAFAGGGAGGQRKQPSRVWVQDMDGKLRMVFLRPGVTDNSYTEVLRGEIKEGDEVLLGEATAKTATTTQMGGPPRGMMFMGR